jgi:hypothetical protein
MTEHRLGVELQKPATQQDSTEKATSKATAFELQVEETAAESGQIAPIWNDLETVASSVRGPIDAMQTLAMPETLLSTIRETQAVAANVRASLEAVRPPVSMLRDLEAVASSVRGPVEAMQRLHAETLAIPASLSSTIRETQAVAANFRASLEAVRPPISMLRDLETVASSVRGDIVKCCVWRDLMATSFGGSNYRFLFSVLDCS